MMQITFKYVTFKSDAAFLQIKQTEVEELPYYLYFFYLHVCSSIFSLIAGFTQFSTTFLKQYPKAHRYLGKFYVFVVLFLAAPSGFVIGRHANGGVYAILSFMLLAVLWFFFTLKGVLYIQKGYREAHGEFMYRSYALAFSAVTLRFWKVVLVHLFHPAPMDVYQLIAWLGWIPNLIIVEYYIYKTKRK